MLNKAALLLGTGRKPPALALGSRNSSVRLLPMTTGLHGRSMRVLSWCRARPARPEDQPGDGAADRAAVASDRELGVQHLQARADMPPRQQPASLQREAVAS